MDSLEASTLLSRFVFLMELEGEGPFKTRAYSQLIELLETTPLSFADFVQQSEQGLLKGVGAQLRRDLRSLLDTGSFEMFELLQGKYPASLLELWEVPGLGAKKIRVLYDELKVQTLDELIVACQHSKLATLKGFGEKSQAKFLAGALELLAFKKKALLSVASDLATFVQTEIFADHVHGVLVGTLRRTATVIDQLDFLLSFAFRASLLERLLASPVFPMVIEVGPELLRAETAQGFPLLFHFCKEQELVSEQFRLTGSEEHVAAVRQRSSSNKNSISFRTEEELYAAAQLAFVPAECREGTDEIEFASSLKQVGKEFPPLVVPSDLKGILHAHSHYSDGKQSLREMALATQTRGYEYLGISDHSQSAGYANGMRIDAIWRQHQEIDRLNEELKPFCVFKGIEVDILEDGRLDYADDVLALFDFVIISVHSRFSLDEKTMTARIIKAIEHPLVHILAHPTGRLLLKRQPYAVNMAEVLESCSKNRVAVEINSNPRRLDLDWQWLAKARSLNIPVPISPDAHSVANLENVSFGISMARKGRLEKSHILNCLSAADLKQYFSAKRTNG